MKRRNKDITEIEEALARFHQESAPVEPCEHWRHRVMSRIREEAVAGNKAVENGFNYYGNTVWRLAIAGAFVALLFAIYAFNADINSKYELADLMLWDSGGFDIARSLGVL
ncbi:MAG: hypothetical protein AB2L11_00350 [Syntrophobacteraceae bacterium]